MSVDQNDDSAGLDTRTAHTARMYDWYLGGKDNYEADRIRAEDVVQAFPSVRLAARINRAFMHRATTYLAGAGIEQFLDIGTGIPTEPNLHQVAQAVTPRAHVAYVDNDPLVLTHARALMMSTPEGRTTYVQADVTAPDHILTAPDLLDTLDLTRPVAISLVALMHFVPDDHGAYDIVAHLMDAVPTGSYLVMSHATPDFDAEAFAEITRIYRNSGIPATFRSRQEVEQFFTGLDLIEPGVTTPHRWHPDLAVPQPSEHPILEPVDTDDLDKQVGFYAGVARKPPP